MELWDGRLQGELSFDVGRPLPYLVAALSLEAFDPRRLAAWLGVPSVLAAPASLHLEATGAGDNVHALVGSLIGEVELVARGRRPARGPARGLRGIFGSAAGDPWPRRIGGIAANFALERGMLVAQPVELDLGGRRRIWKASSTCSLGGRPDPALG